MSAAPPFDEVAAVDLGSNSFHMVVAQLVHGQLQVVDRLRERVALAEGLDGERRLQPKVQERALECLTRFGERLRGMPPGSVRAVGTDTLRRARQARAFLARAEQALGFPIEVIAGREEARLIYLGVSQAHADDSERRLVLDIGGGSTELILGEGSDTLISDSLQMGCVGWSLRFFPQGELTRDAMQRARIAAGLELQGLSRRYRALGWQSCTGSSGTIVASEEILRLNGWGEGDIRPKGLRKLRKALYQAGKIEELALPGLQADRSPVLAGGVAILSAVIDSLGIERLAASPGALREGVLHDLLGRIRHEDVRDPTIRRFAQAYHVDLEQAARVERTALSLLEQVAPAWELTEPGAARMLGWAARLHEIGLSIAYSGYHKHGAYIAANADMPGFSRQDQLVLSLLILSHRRKLVRAAFEELPERVAALALHLALLLRLAVLLNRARSNRGFPVPEASASRDALKLRFAERALSEHPLTRADLEQEVESWREVGYELGLA